eukprot:CAMPEP_0204840830 /NCGR_PEP_ID=MMETSP1346-20131115/39225_1 /ASSEMBLY_ACC=CAM_ASM_000771 /TAXON_ID=215587 /ORGANISM="Aplanochytrium stocchinoi, Strain GSBS06" /LENGTH=181 /DNA_ID=CAMNT_0051978483 /DNA_START=181 /DNA_END=723 /DNA_ORIENTATION=-
MYQANMFKVNNYGIAKNVNIGEDVWRFMGRQVLKKFGQKIFTGVVHFKKDNEPHPYIVRYNDGDLETYSLEELVNEFFRFCSRCENLFQKVHPLGEENLIENICRVCTLCTPTKSTLPKYVYVLQRKRVQKKTTFTYLLHYQKGMVVAENGSYRVLMKNDNDDNDNDTRIYSLSEIKRLPT